MLSRVDGYTKQNERVKVMYGYGPFDHDDCNNCDEPREEWNDVYNCPQEDIDEWIAGLQ